MKMTRLFQIGILCIIPLLASCLDYLNYDIVMATPTDVTVVPGDTQATVTWGATNAGYMISLKYTLKYQPTSESPDSCNATFTKGSCKLGCKIGQNSNGLNTCKVTGLTNGTSYTFVIIAISESDEDNYGGTAVVRTDPVIPKAGK